MSSSVRCNTQRSFAERFPTSSVSAAVKLVILCSAIFIDVIIYLNVYICPVLLLLCVFLYCLNTCNTEEFVYEMMFFFIFVYVRKSRLNIYVDEMQMSLCHFVDKARQGVYVLLFFVKVYIVNSFST